jgi:peptidoglycan/xylan/chitin deacetylase (PgdA/CDA1 family)
LAPSGCCACCANWTSLRPGSCPATRLTPPHHRRQSRRHEIAHHGYFHERAKTSEDEAADFDRATAALKRVTGREPVGSRSPADGLMPSTLDCLIERNFLYDSSMMGNDFSPYYCRVGDQAPADGPFIVLKVTPRAIACRIDALPVPGALRARPPNASSSRARHPSSGSLGSNSEAVRPTWSNCLSPGGSTT